MSDLIGAKSVFEVVDNTDEEIYFPMGMFPTLADAMEALDKCTPENMPSDYDYDDSCVVEIRERPYGWKGTGKVVYTRKWQEKYNEETDEYEWIRVSGSPEGE